MWTTTGEKETQQTMRKERVDNNGREGNITNHEERKCGQQRARRKHNKPRGKKVWITPGEKETQQTTRKESVDNNGREGHTTNHEERKCGQQRARKKHNKLRGKKVWTTRARRKHNQRE